jgi:hypothetical protein
MISRPYIILFLGPLLIFLGCLFIGLINSPSALGTGIAMGTLFGHVTLAGSWCALGPVPLIWRLPLSLLWIASLVSAFALNWLFSNVSLDLFFLVAITIGVLGQWFLVQAVLWALIFGADLRLRRLDMAEPYRRQRERQFGIKHLMTLVAIIAVVLGIGRMALRNLPYAFDIDSEMPFIALLCGLAIVLTLPLLLAALLPRFGLLAVVATAMLIAPATEREISVLKLFSPISGGGLNFEYVIYCNGMMGLWVLAFVFVVRVSGYGIGRISAADPDGNS